MRIGNALYYFAYAFWLLVAATRMTRLDDIVTFKYGVLVDVSYYLVVVCMIAKLVLQKVQARQLVWIVALFGLVQLIGQHTAVSKLLAFFWLTCCIGKTSEKKVFWIFFWVHAMLMVLAVSLSRAGVLENLLFLEEGRNRQSLGYDYCAYGGHLLTMLIMVYAYAKEKFHWWEGVIFVVLSVFAYRWTDTRMAFILAIFVVLSVWIIKSFDLTVPDNWISKLVFQGGTMAIILGMWMMQFFYRDDVAWMHWLDEKLNHRLILGYKAYQKYDMKLFGQKVNWVGAMSVRNDPSLEYLTVDNSYLRFAFQYGAVLMVLLLIAILLLQGRLLKQKNTLLLWLSSIFFVSCTINPELLSYKAQPFSLLLGYLLISEKKEQDKTGHKGGWKKEVLKKLFVPLSWMNAVLPKDKKCVMFYSNIGFRDNVRALYEEMIHEGYHKKYQIIVSLNDYQDFAKNCPKEVKCVSNKMGLLYYFRAGYIFYSFGKYPINPGNGQQIINLWHGMPLKRIGNMEEGLKGIKYDYFSKVLATSAFFSDIMQQVFSCESERVLICGQPRTDALFHAFSVEEQKKLWYAGGACKTADFETSKKIVWLPTYRPDEGDELFPTLSHEDMPKLDTYLKEMGAVLWIKLHPLQKYREEDLKAFQFERICVYAQKDVPNIDLYDVLSFSDALITDYSSIYFDYLMLDKPIGFMVGDIGQYQDERGFVFDDPAAYMPGQKIEDYAGLVTFLEGIAQGKDAYKMDRDRVNAVTHQYLDGNNASRLLQMIGLVPENR